MSRRTNNLLWLIAYLTTAVALTAGLVYVRGRTVADLSRPESLAQWRRWKDETQRQSGKENRGPVAREPVRSDEPPALILLRDDFAAVLGVGLLIGSFLFGFLMVLARGVWAGDRKKPPAEPPGTPAP